MTGNIEEVRKAFEAAEDVRPEAGLDPSVADSPQPRTPDSPPPFDGPPSPPTGEQPPDPVEQAARQPLNDYGNGQRFVIHFGDDLMFVPRVGWFTWTGKYWEKDADEIAVRRKAQQISALIGKELGFLALSETEMILIAELEMLSEDISTIELIDFSDRNEAQKGTLRELKAKYRHAQALEERLSKYKNTRRTHAKNAGNTGPLKNLMLESTTTLAVPLDELDKNALDVNTENGVLRFSVRIDGDAEMQAEGCSIERIASVELRPHNRGDRLTKIMPVQYRTDATCPKFDAFLERIQPRAEMRAFLQRSLGLGLTGLLVQKVWFFHGSGANGKSVLVDVVSRIMGDYAASAKIETLLERSKRGGGDATPDLIPLVSARLVRTSEPNQGDRLDEGKIKELTGGEPFKARALHSDFFDFTPQFKLMISGNHKPEIRGDDMGIWRRVLLVPFSVQIPESERRDFDEFVSELTEERDGIFNWLVQGLLDYLENGLQEPVLVTEATREYKEDSDPPGTFLAQNCICTGDPSDIITSRELGLAFNFWMDANGKGVWKSPSTVARRMAAKQKDYVDPATRRGFGKGKASISRYEGIKFNDVFASLLAGASRDNQGRPQAGVPYATPDPD